MINDKLVYAVFQKKKNLIFFWSKNKKGEPIAGCHVSVGPQTVAEISQDRSLLRDLKDRFFKKN